MVNSTYQYIQKKDTRIQRTLCIDVLVTKPSVCGSFDKTKLLPQFPTISNLVSLFSQSRQIQLLINQISFQISAFYPVLYGPTVSMRCLVIFHSLLHSFRFQRKPQISKRLNIPQGKSLFHRFPQLAPYPHSGNAKAHN